MSLLVTFEKVPKEQRVGAGDDTKSLSFVEDEMYSPALRPIQSFDLQKTLPYDLFIISDLLGHAKLWEAMERSISSVTRFCVRESPLNVNASSMATIGKGSASQDLQVS